MIETELGLPFVLRCTYIELINDINKSTEKKRNRDLFFNDLYKNIKDPVYRDFVRFSSELYPDRITKKIAKRNLILGYELLRREGRLNRISKKIFNKSLVEDYHKNPTALIEIIAINSPLVQEDNPIYFDFIKDSGNNFPVFENPKSNNLSNIIKLIMPNNRMHIFSDHLYAYTLFTKSVKK
jgi:hypothetical protein